ncbi:hypothetical protein [Galbibacter pacificus]|uniref:Phage capsid protein n=1 Tax=Galbibacter pacificus TaxID=2996052 RepID=A0ABT6FR56_9FLAO|nr:hypothetical protein [Galbibacter pacificus]MDG3581773.1 hypothetical protein [Galbibacter pacificus]MDG3585753.1 hypothetical protein [Galbibacter pacificus]
MAYDVSNLTSYVEEQNFPLLRKSIFGGRTSELVKIQSGVKGKSAINIWETDVIYQDDDCSRTASGSTVFSQREIEVSPIAIHQDLCPKKLNGYYLQTQLKAGSKDDEIVFEAEYTDEVSAKIAKQNEINFWQGDKTSNDNNLSKFNGFLKQLNGTDYVTGNTEAITAITKENIYGIVEDIDEQIPADVADADDLVIFMGVDSFKKYRSALKEKNLYHYSADNSKFEIEVAGTEQKIVAVNGLNNTGAIVAGRASNFVIGTDLEGEEDNFELWYSKDARVVKMTVAFKLGTQIAFPEQVVYFKTA